MTKNFRVFNVTRGYSLKRSQALRAIAECAAEWVEENISIRNLTLAESIAARKEQARLREPLAVAELPGLKYEPCVRGLIAYRQGQRMVLDATAICAGIYHPSPAC